MANLGKELVRPYLNKKLGMVVHSCHPTYTRNMNRRIAVQAGLGINGETLSKKIPKAKRTGNIAQVWLPSKHKALVLNPGTANKKYFFFSIPSLNSPIIMCLREVFFMFLGSV
jgi:hypothetical protein